MIDERIKELNTPGCGTALLAKMREEAGELAEALVGVSGRRFVYDDKARSAVLSEVADVRIMIWRLMWYFGASADELDIYEEYKIRRQLDRLDRRRERRSKELRRKVGS